MLGYISQPTLPSEYLGQYQMFLVICQHSYDFEVIILTYLFKKKKKKLIYGLRPFVANMNVKNLFKFLFLALSTLNIPIKSVISQPSK